MKTNKGANFLLAVMVLGTWTAARAFQGDPQARARLRNNINTLRLLRMTEALDLTDEQTAKLFPALTRIEKEKAEIQNRMGIEIRNLRLALKAEPVREADIMTLVSRIREMRQSIKQKDEAFDAVLDANLTPVQKGKYLIFLVDFARGLGEKLNQVRQNR